MNSWYIDDFRRYITHDQMTADPVPGTCKPVWVPCAFNIIAGRIFADFYIFTHKDLIASWEQDKK